MGIKAEHTFKFTIDGSTCTLPEMKAALAKAEDAVGQASTLHFSYSAGDQRDPSTLTVSVKPIR